MIKSVGVKFKLIPTKDQEILLKKSIGTARWAYNYALGLKKQAYEELGLNIPEQDIRKIITQLKQTEEYSWLFEASNDVPKQAVKDLDRAFTNFFKKRAQFPKFKSKKQTKESFYIDSIKLKFSPDSKTVHIPNIGKVKLAKEAQQKSVGAITRNNFKIYNIRVTYNKREWFISLSYDYNFQQPELTQEAIGIDLGIKSTAVISNGVVYKNVNKTNKIKKLERRLKHLQRKVSKKYELNKQGNKYIKTKNILKLEKQIAILRNHITNIRKDYNHKMTTEIVRTKPSMIVIETLSVKNMMKNKHLSKSIQQQNFFEIQSMLTYKSERQGTEILKVPRNFPSSKKCSCCGSVKTKLSLSERTYICEYCNAEIDRDLNAAINLKNYGIQYLQQKKIS